MKVVGISSHCKNLWDNLSLLKVKFKTLVCYEVINCTITQTKNREKL